MVDREKLLAVLCKRFPTATPQQVAAAANAIMGLDDEWQEVSGRDTEMGFHVSTSCADICYFASECQRGTEFKIFLRPRFVAPARV